MTAHRSIQCCIAGAVLLQACATPPAPNPLLVQPTMQVRHATNETADAYYQLGRHHQSQGNLELALSGYNYAIARDARHLDARIAAAALHAQQGRLDQARAMMLEVVADYPTVSQAHNNLGYIDYLRGEHASAAQAIRRALTLDRVNERARNNLRLAETALALAQGAAMPAQLTNAEPAPVREPAPAPLAVADTGLADPPRLELVLVVPNVYELKMPKAPAAVAALPVLAAPQASVRVEVTNADGTAGLARRVGTLLGKHGVTVARLSNQRPFGQQATRIVYRPQHAAQAETLRELIGGPVQMAPAASISGVADVKVVLGRDTQRALALRDAAAEPARLAAR